MEMVTHCESASCVGRVFILGDVYEEVAAIGQKDNAILVFAAPKNEIGKKLAKAVMNEDIDALSKILNYELHLSECGIDFEKDPICNRFYEVNGKKVFCREDKLKNSNMVLCLSSDEMSLKDYHDLFENIETCLAEFK
ncbi:hypothetical protein IPA_03095 [Ignicoccus pacificus DSM 13166]|uniref:Uncharacterized protein n=1 Tax=Ignicoccus pacificus DSM 13166 TaxID=940294 RepID=A0A977KAU5_9CREN|nr:hypothetical protein IPA_03095 [Ignicoccus pacificus DSM 13166]